jgi:hypothetical protein
VHLHIKVIARTYETDYETPEYFRCTFLYGTHTYLVLNITLNNKFDVCLTVSNASVQIHRRVDDSSKYVHVYITLNLSASVTKVFRKTFYWSTGVTIRFDIS